VFKDDLKEELSHEFNKLVNKLLNDGPIGLEKRYSEVIKGGKKKNVIIVKLKTQEKMKLKKMKDE